MSDVQRLFVENAGMYTQLSTGAPVLSIAFVRDVLGIPNDRPIPRSALLMSSWVFFAVSSASTVYRYALAKHLRPRTG